MSKTILLIGGGGRECALAWKLKSSSNCDSLFILPGNGGTMAYGENIDLDPLDIEAVVKFGKERKVDLVVVASDGPLAGGLIDAFLKEGIRAWGPTQAAARIESSKAFAKEIMTMINIPTASYQTFQNYKQALAYAQQESYPLVVKASGLALGKGVMICQTFLEAEQALKRIMVKKVFDSPEVVIEKFLEGPEVSCHLFSDGLNYSLFPISQDYKKIGEGNIGLNTGGMGSIAPVGLTNLAHNFVKSESSSSPYYEYRSSPDSLFPCSASRFVSPMNVSHSGFGSALNCIQEDQSDIIQYLNFIENKVIIPLLAELRRRGTPFVGVLYPGIILTKDGPKILEFNARLGDPETQSYLRLLETDLLDIIEASLEQKLDQLEIKWKSGVVVTVVLVSQGYPEKYEKGKIITNIEKAEEIPGVVIFHSGTKKVGDDYFTNGGRVLSISAYGDTKEQALRRAYQAADLISFEGKYFRRDIGNYKL
ncbi:phosphoribosylamine--glycine ligase [Candidatus Azambacteria bacterium]|nr:phosphoribosylamine--glycine ligase [Candidatus Azambacteria bacterium]